MERVLPFAAATSNALRTLPEVPFTNPWAALIIPLLVPLLVLFW